jgi:hypothetical protein
MRGSIAHEKDHGVMPVSCETGTKSGRLALHGAVRLGQLPKAVVWATICVVSGQVGVIVTGMTES